jgi:Serine aminopeptidase, S33
MKRSLEVVVTFSLVASTALYFYISTKLLSRFLPFYATLPIECSLLLFLLRKVALVAILPGSTYFVLSHVERMLAVRHVRLLQSQLRNPGHNITYLLRTASIINNQQIKTEQQKTFSQNLEKIISSVELETLNAARYSVETELRRLETERPPILGYRMPLLGSLQYLKSAAQIDMKAQSYLVDGIDIIFVPETDRPTEKVVLFFNPNAGFMESIASSPDYVHLYKDLGYSYCSFNYRGFGYSQGRSSIRSIIQDAEIVFSFLVNSLKVRRIALHGRSLGGYPAVKLGFKYQEMLDFVVADRTFRSLEATAAVLVGYWSFWSLRLLGLDTGDLLFEWKNISKCQKILAYAEDDEIIRGSAALRDHECQELKVSCGHNGYFDDSEILLFKKYLKH